MIKGQKGGEWGDKREVSGVTRGGEGRQRKAGVVLGGQGGTSLIMRIKSTNNLI